MAHETAKKFGVANATITYWGKRGNVPKGDTIVAMADFFGVSADYLLCRTDDETDYAKNSPKLTEKQKRLLLLKKFVEGDTPKSAYPAHTLFWDHEDRWRSNEI